MNASANSFASATQSRFHSFFAHADLRSVADALREDVFPGLQSYSDERLAVIYGLLGEYSLGEEIVKRLRGSNPEDPFVTVHDIFFRDGFMATFTQNRGDGA
jgi:hypothetical protein